MRAADDVTPIRPPPATSGHLRFRPLMRWDAPLLATVARTLDDRLGGARLRAVVPDFHAHRLTLHFREATLLIRLHPGEAGLFVLDAAEEPVRTFESLRHELQEYDPELLERPALLVVNKVDLIDDEVVRLLEEDLTRAGMPTFFASATTGVGLDDLKDAIFELLPPKPEPIPQTERAASAARPPSVRRHMSGEGWVVSGSEVEALVARFDPSNRDAVAYLQHHFRSLGIDKLLKRAGAKTGDEVHIGRATFDYLSEDQPLEADADDEEMSDEAG